MALVRVYCGLASADHRRPEAVGTWLTVAVVDDSGRLLDVCDFTDDPGGYAQLGTLLTERSNGPTGVAIAADSDDHLITMLLTAAGRPLTFADHDSVDDFAERFCDDESIEEMESPPAERRAIGLARALQAGALSAVALPTPREMAALKPVLAAHAAVTVGRQAAAVALREVLRELYPAALRAYPDPAEAVPLAVLDALPEPGLVNGAATSRGRDAADAVAGQLAATGISDAATIAGAITALRVAIAETPRRNGVSRSLTAAVAGTVREAVAAVRAWDAATDALIDALAERANPPAATPRPPVLRQRHAPAPTSAPPVSRLRAVREATAEHDTVRVPMPRRARSSPSPISVPPAAAAAAPTSPAGPTPAVPLMPVSPAHAGPMPPPPMPPPPMPPPPMPPPTMPTGPAAPAMRPAAHPWVPPAPPEQAPFSAAATISAPPFDARRAGTVPPPPPGMTPMAHAPVSPAPRPVSPAPRPVSSGPRPVSPAAPFRATVTTGQPAGSDFAATEFPSQRPAAAAAPPGSRANWPLVGSTDDQSQEPFMADLAPDPILGDPYAGAMPAVGPSVGLSHRHDDRQDDRVVPPWLADDLPLPPEPPMLRLVEPPPVPDPALRRFGDDLSDSWRFEPPPLRVVDSDGSERASRTAARAGSRRAGPAPVSVPPVAEDGDGDLLIFAAARSAWFTGQATEDEPEWGIADDGWRAAEQAARPAVGADTTAGLPKRVPQANLVPGSPLAAPDRPLRIVRDAASIAEHTSGYFRGWRRGQEIGGFAVGGRPGRESAQGWDFSRDPGDGEYDNDYGYPTAAYHSR